MRKSMGQKPRLLHQASFSSVDEHRTVALSQATACLARAAFQGRDRASCGSLRIELKGDLGAGKTTFVRHFLRSLGITGRIKSPSFSVVESYRSSEGIELHHFDFYRLANPDAWQGGGLRDLLAEPAICLMEWPEKAQGLPSAHIAIAMGWKTSLLADAPREFEVSFFDLADGIALAPHLAQWQQDTACLIAKHQVA